MKRCRDCDQDKPLEDFPPAKKSRDGRASYYRTCMGARSRASYRKRRAAEGRTVRESVEVPPGTALCPRCRTVRPLTDFTRSKAKASGRHSHCKPCHYEQTLESARRLHGSTRDCHLKRRYGLTSDDVDALVDAQGGLCALCQERKAEHVDHDHLTGSVRGVLCFCCNQGLGNFRDRADVMRKAIDYLERTTWQKERACPGVYRLTSPRPGAARSPSSSALQHLICSRRG